VSAADDFPPARRTEIQVQRNQSDGKDQGKKTNQSGCPSPRSAACPL
jgi:hypothetical protein